MIDSTTGEGFPVFICVTFFSRGFQPVSTPDAFFD
jgi:hypothetical protein